MKAIAKTVPGKGVELIDIPAPRARTLYLGAVD